MNHIITRRHGRVGIIQLNQPESKNTLSQKMLEEILEECTAYDRDDTVGAILILGDAKVFSAGGDLREMEGFSSAEAFLRDIFGFSERILEIRKPLVAGVSGYALGGGFELALACDLLIASTSAKFGLPETKLGIIPGMGGTQRLTRAVGKALAMDVCLAGRFLTADEALHYGLVSRVVEPEEIEKAALEIAETIANKPMVATMMAKEAITHADESFLSAGLKHERRLLHSLFATHDQKEGMQAFFEKRDAEYRHQ